MDYCPQEPKGRAIHCDPFFTLMADRDDVGFVHCTDAVLVVPLADDGRVLLAVERSPAFDREVLGLVAGEARIEEPLEQTVNRELQEELGWRAGRLDFLGELRPFKYLTARQFVFLARDLVQSRLVGDEIYPVSEYRVALDGVYDLCVRGELQDAGAIAALYLARHFLSHESARSRESG